VLPAFVRSPRTLVPAFAGVLILGAAGPAAACSLVPPGVGDVGDPRLAMDDAGVVVTTWPRYGASNQAQPRAVTRSSAGAWSPVAGLPAAAAQAPDLQIARDGSGGEVAVWSRGSSVQAATRSAGGRFGAPQMLSTPGTTAYGSQLEVDEDGNATVVWLQSRTAPGTGSDILTAASLPAGGQWTAAQDVTAPGALPREVGLAVAHGHALLTWTSWSGPAHVVQAATRAAADAPFGAPATLSEPNAEQPSGAMNAVGQALVVWTTRIAEGAFPQYSARFAVRAAELLPGGEWSAPVELGAPDGPVPSLLTSCGPLVPAGPPRVVMDAAGEAVAAWFRRLPDQTLALQWSSRPAGGGWGPAADLAPPGVTRLSLELSMDAAGDAVAAWMDPTGLVAARRPAGGGFGGAEPVDPADDRVSAPQVALDDSGRALAVWVHNGGIGHPDQVLAAARGVTGPWTRPEDLTAIAGVPPLALSSVGVQGRARDIVTFRLHNPARVRITVQRGGHGAALRSQTITGRVGLNRVRIPRRAALRPGRYVIRIRAVDAGGRVALRTARLSI